MTMMVMMMVMTTMKKRGGGMCNADYHLITHVQNHVNLQKFSCTIFENIKYM